MSEFQVYLKLGFSHILDLNGFDHILFIVALCAVYVLKDWRKVLILVTAFTIGHSLTLALAALNIFTLPVKITEFLIPVTILITAIFNFFVKHSQSIYIEKRDTSFYRYIIAGIFGLIHGLGFSNFLRALIRPGESITAKLLAFNIGLEVGQLLLVAVILLLSFLCINLFGVSRRDWNLIFSGIAAGIAIKLIIENNIF